MVVADVASAPYGASELEAVARLLLRDERVRVVPGGWWSYYPERGEVVYPPNLLTEWPASRALGALCHEVAEVLFSGREAVGVFERFTAQAGELRCPPPSAQLLLNAINDLRINRLYLEQFPGSRRYFRALYRSATLVPKDDLRAGDLAIHRGRPTPRPLPHHLFVDALTVRWAATLAPTTEPGGAVEDERVRRALARCWPAVERAIAAADLADLAEIVRQDVLPVYAELVEASADDLRRTVAEESEPEPPSPSDEPDEEETSGDEPPPDLRSLLRGNPIDEGPSESWVILPGDEPPSADDEPSRRATPAPPSARPAEPRAPSINGSSWTGGVVQKFRRLGGRRSHAVSPYEEFNYLEAERRLRPQIDALLYGAPGRDGLIAILNRRRFGTLDPWRRPRRRRRGDSGEIDADHPENLLLAPAVAFLKGQRQRRDDSQKDFANAILLDVSGSIVQRGYRSRKFDQLVDTLVVFCEIHQRLKLPYELIAFSDRYAVLRSFDECHYDNLHIDPTSAYVVKDFSYVVREMYHAEHGETHETPALERAIADLRGQRGLKTIFVVTDGISSDRPLLTDRLLEIEQRNQVVPPGERLMVLAFGLGLAEAEFNASYQPEIDGQPIQCSAGRLVPNLEALPTIVCDAVDRRIRTA